MTDQTKTFAKSTTVIVTAIICGFTLDGFILGGTALIVFALHRSPWWWLLGLLLSYSTTVAIYRVMGLQVKGMTS